MATRAQSLHEEDQEARRRRIPAAAHRIILDAGLPRLSTGRLAAAAAVSPPTLYDPIGSREEIMAGLIRETLRRGKHR